MRNMRRAGKDECLVWWTDSFTRDRRVIRSVDGQDGEPMEVTTGLPPGSPISPALFAMRFAGEATRCLGIWLDASLNLEENRRRRIGKTRQKEARLRQIVNQYGLPPASARNLQAAIVQGTMLYASELTWNGQDKVEGPYQLAINRMARATLGVHQSTPRGIIMAESGVTPARALLDHRRARFAQ